ncbi:MAG: hypothetical protein WBS22_16320 [Methylocystis sp.]
MNTLIEGHGAFVLSTRAGAENFALAKDVKTTAAREAEERLAAEDLIEEFKKNPEVVGPAATKLFSDTMLQAESPTHPERSGAYKAGMGQNIAIVLAATATAGVFVASAATLAGTIAGGGAGGAMLPVYEGLKKSKPFLEISGVVTKTLDGLQEKDLRAELERLQRIPFARYREFILRNEDRLRRLVGDRATAPWLYAHLDWLKKQSEYAEG